MLTIKFTAELEPVPFKRPRFNGKFAFNDAKYSAYKKALGYVAKRAMRGAAPCCGAIKINVKVYREFKPTALKFGDADNHLKAALDALNGICYSDDRQIVEATVRLFKGKSRVEIELEELA